MKEVRRMGLGVDKLFRTMLSGLRQFPEHQKEALQQQYDANVLSFRHRFFDMFLKKRADDAQIRAKMRAFVQNEFRPVAYRDYQAILASQSEMTLEQMEALAGVQVREGVAQTLMYGSNPLAFEQFLEKPKKPRIATSSGVSRYDWRRSPSARRRSDQVLYSSPYDRWLKLRQTDFKKPDDETEGGYDLQPFVGSVVQNDQDYIRDGNLAKLSTVIGMNPRMDLVFSDGLTGSIFGHRVIGRAETTDFVAHEEERERWRQEKERSRSRGYGKRRRRY